jgi:hypothetical protein
MGLPEEVRHDRRGVRSVMTLGSYAVNRIAEHHGSRISTRGPVFEDRLQSALAFTLAGNRQNSARLAPVGTRKVEMIGEMALRTVKVFLSVCLRLLNR